MNSKLWAVAWLIALSALVSQRSVAGVPDFIASTPVGSWQLREDITTDEKGRQTVMLVKTSMLEKINFQGAPHYWIEVTMESYRLRKGKRKAQGEPVVMKTLVEASVISENPENVAANLQKFGKEIILQSGNGDPMRIAEGGALAQMMMKSLGVSVDYSYTEAGTKVVEVPAGKFNCTVMRGEGTTEVRVIMRKISVASRIESCTSGQVPFGVVAYATVSTENGKETRSEARLMEFGKTGAVSSITRAPVDMPEIPKLF